MNIVHCGPVKTRTKVKHYNVWVKGLKQPHTQRGKKERDTTSQRGIWGKNDGGADVSHNNNQKIKQLKNWEKEAKGFYHFAWGVPGDPGIK